MGDPTQGAWGQKALNEYLKDGLEEGNLWDSTELLSKIGPQSHPDLKVLIDYVGILLTLWLLYL